MRIVFAGTGSFAVPSLEAIADLCKRPGYELVGVYTRPDRLMGRRRSILQTSPIKQFAQVNGLDIYQPPSLKKQAHQMALQQLMPDLVVVADYGLLLPIVVLTLPKWGCINVHGSLLPRWRGAAPIQRALLAGDRSTGVTIMQMDVGLDTGSILSQISEPILSSDTSATLTTRLAVLGAQLLPEIVVAIEQGKVAVPQPTDGACYAHKLMKEEGQIDWSLSAIAIHRQIRAFIPWPISFTWLNGEKLRVWEASIRAERNTDNEGLPGTIVRIERNTIQVSTGAGELALHCLQREGGRVLKTRDLLNGALSRLSVGMRFINPL